MSIQFPHFNACAQDPKRPSVYPTGITMQLLLPFFVCWIFQNTKKRFSWDTESLIMSCREWLYSGPVCRPFRRSLVKLPSWQVSLWTRGLNSVDQIMLCRCALLMPIHSELTLVQLATQHTQTHTATHGVGHVHVHLELTFVVQLLTWHRQTHEANLLRKRTAARHMQTLCRSVRLSGHRGRAAIRALTTDFPTCLLHASHIHSLNLLHGIDLLLLKCNLSFHKKSLGPVKVKVGNGFNTTYNLKQPIINIIRHNHFALSKFASNAEQWYPYKPVLVHLALHAKDKCRYLAMTHMNELGLVHSNTFKTEQHGCVRHSSYSMSLMSLETDELSIVPHLQWFQHTAIHLAPHHRNKTCTKRRYALCRLMTTWATSSGN